MVAEQKKALTTILPLGPLPEALSARPAPQPRIQTAQLTPFQDAIRRGEAGPRVAKLHAELYELGFLVKRGLPPYFGVATDTAVRTFQRAWRLPADGAVGPSTQQAIDLALSRVRDGTGERALTYLVRQGDSLLRIAHSMLGDPGRWREIIAFNDMVDPNKIVPGMVLRIPPRR